MGKLFKRSSIKTKITGVIMLTIFISAFFSIFLGITRQIKEVRRGLELKGVSIAEMLAYNVSPGLEFGDRQYVEDAIQGAKKDKDFVYVKVFDSSGKEFYSFKSQEAKEFGRPGSKEKLSISEEILTISAPIYSHQNRIGLLSLGLSLANLNQEISRNRKLVFLIFFCTVFLGILIANYLGNLLTCPILQLRDAAQKLSSGETEVKVKISSSDEIGFLADAFNEMTESLNRFKKQLIQEKELLKKNVAELKIAQEKLRLVNEIGKKINSILDLDHLLLEMVKSIKDTFHFYVVTIAVVEGDWVVVKKSYGAGKGSWISKISRLKIGEEGIIGWVAKNGKPLLIPDVNSDPRYYSVEELNQTKSELCVPIVSQEKVVGTLDVQSDKLNAFDQSDLELLQSIAAQISVALQNAGLYQGAENWIGQLEAVRNISNRLNKINDVKAIAATIVEETKKVIEFDNCRVYLVDEKRRELVPVAFGSEVEPYKHETAETLRLKIGEGITGWVAETKEAELIGDVEKHPKARHIPGTPYLDESMIASPMIYEGKVLGVITLSQLGLNQFHSNHLRLLNILAVQAGISIQNARLFADLKKAYQELKLTQSQLVQKEKLASIGQLAAGLAHELNNPLGGILGYSQFASEKIAKKSPKDLTLEDIASYSQYLKEIEQQTQRCKIIVQNLLRFAQATTKVPFEPLDLNRALKEVILFTKEELKRRKVELKENFSKSLPTVIGNSNQLKQVFTHLIFNALQAMPDGGQIMITTAIGEEKETFKKKVLISFSDTGCGIPQDRLDKIFDPFYTTKNTGEGTGLGLSVCYGIIRGKFW